MCLTARIWAYSFKKVYFTMIRCFIIFFPVRLYKNSTIVMIVMLSGVHHRLGCPVLAGDGLTFIEMTRCPVPTIGEVGLVSSPLLDDH